MSTCNRADARGAGPSAAIRPEPVLHVAANPTCCSQATAARMPEGSGPNSAAYASGETVCPDAISLDRFAGSRTFSPKLSETVTASPAGPRWIAVRMAAARVGGGGAGCEIPGACADGLAEFEGPQATSASTRATVKAVLTER